MKTGGTLNFLKRAGAIFMLLAIFASSCNKYADDFDQINTKLDALATSVAGVAQLTTDMAALKSQVAALTTAIAALPTKTQMDAGFAGLTSSMTAITGKIDAITATLATVASTGTSTKAVVDQLKLDLAALADKVATDNAAMALQLSGLASDNVTMKANLQAIIDANTALALQITAVQDQITALVDATGTDATAVTIKGLQLMLIDAQTSLNTLLANSNMFTGPVNITSDAEVTFYLPIIGAWKDGGMVNGSVTINATAITNLTGLKTITDNLIAVIGGNTLTITGASAKPLTFAKLSSVVGNIAVTANDVDEVSFAALTAVTANYSVAGWDIDDAALTTVGGSVTLNYDGGYSQPALASTGAIILTDYVTGVGVVGTLDVDFSGLITATSIRTGGVLGTPGTATFASATSVALGQVPYTAITANAASTVNLAYSATGGLTTASVSATTAGSTITLGLKKITGATPNTLAVVGSATSIVNLPNFATDAGDLAITALTLSAPALTSVTGTVGLTNTTPVSLPVLATSGAITAGSAVTFTAPVLDVTSIALSAAATTVEVGTTSGSEFTATTAAFVNLTIDALSETLTMPTSVVTAVVTGKDGGTYATTNSVVGAAVGNTLKTLTLNGVIKTATVTSTGLTSLTTSGVVNALNVIGCTNTALTSLSLGHSHYVGGPGSILVIGGNTKLTSLTTSTDKVSVLAVYGNSALATMDFASYQNLPNAGATVNISIGWDPIGVAWSANKLVGTYTAPVLGSATSPFIEGSVAQSSLASLKSYVAALAALTPSAFSGTGSLKVTVEDADGALLVNPTLQSVMVGPFTNAFGTSVIDATGGINTAAEFSIVQ